jgi:DNA gyrase subunit A
MGRSASGVRAIKLGKGDIVVGSVVLRRSGTSILVATEKGFGKRSETGEYRVSHRGGKGIFTVKTTEKTGKMVAIREVVESDDVVIVTSGGIVIRQHASEIRLAGRNTQGVRLIRLDVGDSIADVAAVVSEEDEAPTNDTNGNGSATARGAAEEPEAGAPEDGQASLFDGDGDGETKRTPVKKEEKAKPAKEAPAKAPSKESKKAQPPAKGAKVPPKKAEATPAPKAAKKGKKK